MLKYISFFTLILCFTSCQKDPIIPAANYDCNLSFTDESAEHPKSAQFSSEMEAFIGQTPGVQIAITTADGLTWTYADGYADIPSDVALKTCTKTMIGSTSKIVTAVLIMQLQEEGLLSLDDKVSDWLDDRVIGELANAKESNIRQLLNHSSGIPEYLAVRHFINSVNIPNHLETQEEKLKYAYGKSATNAIGAKYEYSNSNYILLGLIIEEAREMPLWDAVQTHISMPLGLQNFVMGTEEEPIPSDCARPYLSTRGGKYSDIMQHAVADAATGDGGIACNMQDFNAFLTGMQDGTLISAESFAMMTEDAISQAGSSSYGGPDFGEEFYGLGLERYERGGHFSFGHTGGTSSYEAYAVFDPTTEVIVSLAFNGISTRDDTDSEREEILWKLIDIAAE